MIPRTSSGGLGSVYNDDTTNNTIIITAPEILNQHSKTGQLEKEREGMKEEEEKKEQGSDCTGRDPTTKRSHAVQPASIRAYIRRKHQGPELGHCSCVIVERPRVGNWALVHLLIPHVCRDVDRPLPHKIRVMHFSQSRSACTSEFLATALRQIYEHRKIRTISGQ